MQEDQTDYFAVTLDIVSDGVWDWDANTGVVNRSPGWYRMLGYDVDSLPKTVFTWEDIIHPEDYEAVMQHFEDYITKKTDTYCIKYRCKRLRDDYLWIEDRGRVVAWNDDGTVARMIGAHRDINDEVSCMHNLILKNEGLIEEKSSLEAIIKTRTQELTSLNKKLLEKIKEVKMMAETDSLTSICNRHKFDVELQKEMKRSNRYHMPLSVIMFDIDDFKMVNDTMGHLGGDRVLCDVASSVSGMIRSSDLMARWGGDEFIILLPGCDKKEALLSAQKISDAVSALIFADGRLISCSFGVTQYVENEEIDDLMTRLDQALYHSKESDLIAAVAY